MIVPILPYSISNAWLGKGVNLIAIKPARAVKI
jgi:hypothetical protein